MSLIDRFDGLGFEGNWKKIFSRLGTSALTLCVVTNYESLTYDSINQNPTMLLSFYSPNLAYLLLAFSFVFIMWLIYKKQVSQLRAVNVAQSQFIQRLIINQESERKRIASELHDGLGQNLAIIKNRALLGLREQVDREQVKTELDSICEAATLALDEVRGITNDLRPQLLDRLGLTKTIVVMIKKLAAIVEIKSEIDSIDNVFIENEEIILYRIIQESLNNVIKHSNASDASVSIKLTTTEILISIEDNGKGFDIETAKSNSNGLGLAGLKERAQMINGVIVIDSKLEEGTAISLRIPIRGRQNI